MNVINTDRRQLMRGQKRDEARDHNNQAKDGKLLAYVHERFALFGASQIAQVADYSNDQRHEKSVQPCVEDHVANDDSKSLHARIDCLLKAKTAVVFHFEILTGPGKPWQR